RPPRRSLRLPFAPYPYPSPPHRVAVRSVARVSRFAAASLLWSARSAASVVGVVAADHQPAERRGEKPLRTPPPRSSQRDCHERIATRSLGGSSNRLRKLVLRLSVVKLRLQEERLGFKLLRSGCCGLRAQVGSSLKLLR